MRIFLALFVLILATGCGGSGGDAAPATPGNCSVGDVVSTGGGDILIIQDCIDGNGNAVVICTNPAGESVSCGAGGGTTTLPTPRPT